MSLDINFERGIPPHEFFGEAWASEPLTNVLQDTNIPFALPFPDEDISLVAKEGDLVIGQCSANRVIKYWKHIENIDSSNQNLSTQIFIKIHKKAVSAERAYLEEIKEPIEKAFHNAGVAVLPSYRQHKIGLSLETKQVELCREMQFTTLFYEATNKYSANIVERLGFTQIAKYSYSSLAEEFHHPELNKLDDSFTVWCKKV